MVLHLLHGGIFMKATGSIRPLDDLGRIVVPKVIRKRLELVENQDYVEIYIRDGNILLRKCKEDDLPSITRKVDEFGRVVIPKEIRRSFDLKEKIDSVEIFVDDDAQIILKKYEPGCVFCGYVGRTHPFKQRYICEDCLKEIKELG